MPTGVVLDICRNNQNMNFSHGAATLSKYDNNSVHKQTKCFMECHVFSANFKVLRSLFRCVLHTPKFRVILVWASETAIFGYNAGI